MTIRPGPRNLITDVAGLKVGNAGDDRLKSGVTVLTADTPFTAAVHVRRKTAARLVAHDRGCARDLSTDPIEHAAVNPGHW